MKKIFLLSGLLPLCGFVLLILKICNVINCSYEVALIPLYIWLIFLGVAFTIWFLKEEKDNG